MCLIYASLAGYVYTGYAHTTLSQHRSLYVPTTSSKHRQNTRFQTLTRENAFIHASMPPYIRTCLAYPYTHTHTHTYAQHSAAFSKVCSLGWEIENQVLNGELVLESVEQEILPPEVYPGEDVCMYMCVYVIYPRENSWMSLYATESCHCEF
jgi:hypothetical protein